MDSFYNSDMHADVSIASIIIFLVILTSTYVVQNY